MNLSINLVMSLGAESQDVRSERNSTYLPGGGDPGPYGGGTYTRSSMEPTVEQYENIFGPAARDIKVDHLRNKRHQRWHLPDVLKGPNEFLTTRIDGYISDPANSPFTSEILPYKYIDNPDQKLKWNVYAFDEGMASRVPYESAARVLTQTKKSFAGYTIRQGLAIRMEHNFMVSPEGRQNFLNQLNQMVGSVQLTNDLDVHMALIQAPSYARTMAEKYHSSDKTASQICREYVDLYGIMQKNPNGLDILIEDAKGVLRTWGSTPPDFLLCNAKLTMQMQMTPERTSYTVNGPEGQKRLKQGPEIAKYRGLKIINTRSFSIETGAPPRDLLRRRVRVAEYYRVPPMADMQNKMIQLYDESKNTWFSLTYDDLCAHAKVTGSGGYDNSGRRFASMIPPQTTQMTLDSFHNLTYSEKVQIAMQGNVDLLGSSNNVFLSSPGLDMDPNLPDSTKKFLLTSEKGGGFFNDFSETAGERQWDYLLGSQALSDDAGFGNPNGMLNSQTKEHVGGPHSNLNHLLITQTSMTQLLLVSAHMNDAILDSLRGEHKVNDGDETAQEMYRLMYNELSAEKITVEQAAEIIYGENQNLRSKASLLMMAYCSTHDTVRRYCRGVLEQMNIDLEKFERNVTNFVIREATELAFPERLQTTGVNHYYIVWDRRERANALSGIMQDFGEWGENEGDYLSRFTTTFYLTGRQQSEVRNLYETGFSPTRCAAALAMLLAKRVYGPMSRYNWFDLLSNKTLSIITTDTPMMTGPGGDGESGGNGSGNSGGVGFNKATGKSEEFVIIRPCIEHNMLGVILGKGGGEYLGNTLWGQTELSCYDDGMYGLWGMSYKYHEKALVTNEKNLIRIFDVAFDGYNGGMDDSAVNWDEHEEFAQHVNDTSRPYQGPSMMIMRFQVDAKSPQWKRNWPSPIVFYDHEAQDNARMTVDPENIHALGSGVEKFRVFNSTLYKDDYDKYKALMPQFGYLHTTRPSATTASVEGTTCQYGLAFQGSMRILNQNGSLLQEIHGSGHLGPSYVGVSAIREGKGFNTYTAGPQLTRTV